MKTESMKNNIKSMLIRNGGIIVVLALVCGGAFYYWTTLEDQKTELETQITSIRNQITASNAQFIESEKQLQEFKQINKNRLATEEGYTSARDRLKVILPMVKQMRDIYLFKTLNLNISEIKTNDAYTSAYTKAYQNKVSFDVEGSTDEFIYSFINDLKYKLPGYINVVSINMSKDNDINDSTITAYFRDKQFKFISGKIELEWTTLKSNPEMPAAAAAPENAAPIPPTGQ